MSLRVKGIRGGGLRHRSGLRVPGALIATNRRSPGPIGSVWVPCRSRLTAMTLLFLAFWAADPWNYASAAQLARAGQGERRVPAADQAGQELEAAIAGTLAALAAVRADAVAAKASRGTSRLEEEWQALQEADGRIRSSFREIEEHLEAAGLPPTILQRHRHAVDRYESGFDLVAAAVERALSLSKSLEPGTAGEQKRELLTALGAAKRRLSSMVALPVHTALDPHQLPHRLATPERRAPRLKSEQFKELFAEGTRSGSATAKVLGFSAKAAAPGPQDLAPTPEVQLTPEISQQAADLGGDPIRIFNFVHDRVSFTPTRGSIQGAASCLRTLRCNDMDTASLLIALLRASGIPARYAAGTIEVDIEKIKNVAGGFSDAEAALNFIASSGTPVTGVTAGGNLISARLEHAWVEAFLDYVPSRGTARGTPDTWVPLDPSFKQVAVAGGINVPAVTGLDSEAFFNQLVTGATGVAEDGELQSVNIAAMEQKLAEVQGQIVAFANSRGTQATVLNTLGGVSIVSQALPVLPGSLPYRVVVRGGQFSEVPDALRHKLLFEVSSDSFGLSTELSYSARMPQLAGKKITLSYAPATPADQAALESFIPVGATSMEQLPTSLPAYLIQVRPELRIDGEVVATGAGTTLGRSGRFQMSFNGPGTGTETVDNSITAGTYNAIVLNLGVPDDPDARRQAAQVVKDRVAAGDVAGLTKDDVMGELLHTEGLVYWSQIELFEKAAASAQRIVSSRLPSEGIFTYDLKVQTLFGVPRTVSSGSMTTDVDRDVTAAASLDGDNGRIVGFMATTGGFASRTESSIYDHHLSPTPTGAGINAISYIEAAARQGISIFHINRDNLARVLPRLAVSAAVKTDIQNAVNAGKVVTIPQREFLKDGFIGVGYIVFDLATGAAGYLISSGLAGGGFQLPSLDAMTAFLLGILFTGIGAIAFPLGIMWLVVVAAILSILLAVYDAISTYQQIARDNPNLTPDQLDGIAGILAMIAIVTIGFALAGIFGGPLGMLAFTVYWCFASVMLAQILQFYLNLIRARIPPVALLNRRRKRDERLAAGSGGLAPRPCGQPQWA